MGLVFKARIALIPVAKYTLLRPFSEILVKRGGQKEREEGKGEKKPMLYAYSEAHK